MSRAKYYLSYAMARKSSNEVQGFGLFKTCIIELLYIIIYYNIL